MKLTKKQKEVKDLVKPGQEYSLEDAAALVEKFAARNFDESVDLAIKLGVDPRKAEENIRGTVSLPHGTGKTLRVAVFCKPEKEADAKAAGADFVGGEELVAKVQTEGWLDFDAAIATPDMMVSVGKIGKVLGPRGLMPNPKTGTVTFEVGKAVEAIKSGRVEFRVEKAGIVHAGVGRRSFGKDKIIDNAKALIDALLKAKPQTSKGIYLQSIHLSTTMGPGLKVDAIPFRG